MSLRRPPRALPAVSIVPLIDVLLILLVFFMVTSTFLDLDMLPLISAEGGSSGTADRGTVLVRIVPDGGLVAAGQAIGAEDIAAFLAQRIAETPGARLMVLPSPRADVSALVRVLDTADALGFSDVAVIRFGDGP